MTKQTRLPKLWEALLSFGFLIAIAAVAILRYETSVHVPMVFGAAFAASMAVRLGYSWKQIETSMFDGVRSALPAVVILVLVGALIGIWILAGVVPSMIYYGLHIINPSFFLVTALLVCSITSLATGTSWGTAGTVGVAFMGIASGMGIPLGVAAGAVVSGAYFGDKLSPLSDTTVMSSSIAGVDTIAHIKHMSKNTIVAYIITVVGFLILGMRYSGSADSETIMALQSGILEHFNVSPILLLPPVIVIVTIALKAPALVGIFAGLIAGIVMAMSMQGVDIGRIFSVGYSGFRLESDIFELTRLFNRGGMTSVGYAIFMIIPAMCFGGIMELTKQLEVIVDNVLLKLAKGTTSLMATSAATTFLINVATAEQYMAVILPNKMFAKSFRDRDLHPKMLSSSTDTTGTLTSALVPWNTCGAFMMSVLGVSAFAYAPYALFNILAPLTLIGMAAIGKMKVKISDDVQSLSDTERAHYDLKQEQLASAAVGE